MVKKILLLASILILVVAACSCAVDPTTLTTVVTKTTWTTKTATTTQTETATITETATVTETFIATAITIKVKTSQHGDGTVATLDMESEYLPVVVASENPEAPYESFKAQAIAARTFAFFKKVYEPRSTLFDVYDYETDQVYDPARWDNLTPQKQEEIRRAVRETNGIILRYANVIVCSCYVSGKPSTAQYVTYNEGKSGNDITQTTLLNHSYPPSRTPHNRGCMGQIQANALAAEQGYTCEQIIRYFYGEDIIIEKYSAYY
ncbi:MAG: SpoIID/LytB domain-containing protein [Dehalococcoidales bacterium]|nr:SpoIID/LytB domain-containing protein [Dehalococcoidales bacterium]